MPLLPELQPIADWSHVLEEFQCRQRLSLFTSRCPQRVKRRRLALSKTSPVCPRKRTLTHQFLMSQKGHNRTHAPGSGLKLETFI